MTKRISEREVNQSIKELLVIKDRYKKLYQESRESLDRINSMLFSIGAPLNDNCLKFNKDQLIFIQKIAYEVKE